MKFKKFRNKYFIRLEKGEKIIETLLGFLEKEKIKAGFFNGLGAVSSVVIAHYNLDKKKYSEKELKGQREIVSFHGNLSRFEGKPYVHAHICVGDDKMKLVGGHCKEGVVAATCEIVLISLEVDVGRYADKEIGLNLWDF
jgi:uncharacterized protein